jgi:sugar lactone lactonase YvrE
MRDIAIGADGSVFAITFEGALVRWNNTRNTFIPFPGQFSQIAVAPDGKPWGIAATGEVFHFDGTTWQQIPQTQAKDIAIGFDGTIIIVDANLFLQRFDTKQNSFTRLPLDENGNPPSGRQVAVTPSGKPWVIDHDGFINSCEKKSCKRLAIKAISLAIGPEGSILIIDSNRQLKRWSSHKKTFDTIESIVDLVSQVAVGPRGKPWLLSTSSELWASAFFPRDESRDLITTGSANAQQNASTPPSPPVFRFTESRLFEKISNIVSPFNLPLEFGTQQIAISPTSGQATLIDADHNFYSFRDSSRALVRNTRIAAPESLSGDSIRSFIIDKDENYWISSYFENSVWRYQRNSWTQIPHDWSSGSGSITIARSPDNTIYATGTDGQLYRYDTSRQRFTQVTMPLPNGRINGIAISADNHFWVTSDVGTAGLYEYTGNRWVLRLPNNNNWLGECTSEVNTCLATGAEGSIYTLDTSSPSYYQLQRWNPSTGSWQSFNNSPNLSIRARFVIGNDGRPWAIQRSSAGTGEGLYRAR